MKKIIPFAVFMLAACLLTTGCEKKATSESETETITLTYANFPPASTFPCVQMEHWAQEVERRTGGKVKINTFAGSTLLGAKEMMDGVKAGQADIGCLCMAYQPGAFAVTNATSLPLNIPNAKVGSLVLLDLFKKYNPAEFADVKVLTMFTTAPSNLMTKKPVRTMADMQNMNIRASGGAADILKAWRANLVAMPMSEVPEALQKGVIEGIFSSLEAMKDFRYAEYCKYITMTDTVIYPFAVVMNKEKYQSLDQDVKDVFEEMIDYQCLWTGTYMDEHVDESIAWSVQNHNVEVINISPDEKPLWDLILQPLIKEGTQKLNDQGLDGEQIVADIKASIATHSAVYGNK